MNLPDLYRHTLLDDVIPFWLRHGVDREYGGFLTALDRDGSVIDTDKSVWFQGRGAWTFATLCLKYGDRPEWRDAAAGAIDFLRRYCFSPSGKMYFTVTRDGRPLRMRRYVFSESFAAIACAAWHRLTGEEQARGDALRCFATYLQHSFTPGVMPAKVDPATRPMTGIGPLMIGIATAQELRRHLGDVIVEDRSMTGWIDFAIDRIERLFMKPQHRALMEVVAPDGGIIDHFDGRTLNPGHALECAWFLMEEGRHRGAARLIELGTTILDWMWERGWDQQFGGIFYFRDLRDLPVQEYWHDMKFWWPHNEAEIATLMAWKLTGRQKYADWHRLVHDWSFKHFPDPEHGEWYGYLHRDGSVSTRLKGNMWKGLFHLPRMLMVCGKLAE
ncbi:AGE family epimerase/isomerase [Humisphaera borealis]|uniref:AGE family epimerase/isomerase n=1 Tax=Humisphaera borealis TaxID=2807512 RepID=A0A7M2WTS5_9BACT|nr:AGE family epimerase/isomerase [Humisphaera borealis]QOV88853.1 AGE family epimerase/isomerase [Humisphaera borealis]